MQPLQKASNNGTVSRQPPHDPVLWQTLTLDPTTFATLSNAPSPVLLVSVIIFLAGGSTLIRQSAVLFLNRIQPARFAYSLLLNGIMWLASFALWALVLWVIASLLGERELIPLAVFTIIGLSSAPFVFGILIFLPYVGELIARILYVWSLLGMLRIVEVVAATSWGNALLLVTVGWVLMLVVSRTVGAPLVKLRDWLWKNTLGGVTYTTPQQLFSKFVTDVQQQVENKQEPQ